MTFQRTARRSPTSTTCSDGVVTPTHSAAYHVTRRRLNLDSVVVEVLTTGPHRLDRGACADGSRARIVVTIVGGGSIVGSVDDRQISLRRGDVAVSDDRQQLHYVAEGDLAVLRVLVDVGEIPDRLLSSELFPVTVVRRTMLVNSAVAFISALFTRVETVPPTDDPDLNEYLHEAIVTITTSLIAEAQRDVRGEIDGTDDLRARIERYTIEHLADHDLSPVVVARAVGISVRYAHQVFNRDDTTLARFIRDRRLDQVAAELRDGRVTASLGDLGRRYGFGSRDQLARGFRQRFGQTMGEYRAEWARGQGAGGR